MKETHLTSNISANIGRAAQHELEGDLKSELIHLLFAARDITTELKIYRAARMHRSPIEWMDLSTAKRYAAMLHSISTRVCELIEDGA